MKIALILQEILLSLPFFPVAIILVSLYSVLHSAELLLRRHFLFRTSDSVWNSAVSGASEFSRHVRKFASRFYFSGLSLLLGFLRCLREPVPTITISDKSAVSRKLVFNFQNSNLTSSNQINSRPSGSGGRTHLLFLVQSSNSAFVKFLLRVFCAAADVKFLCAVIPECYCAQNFCFGSHRLLRRLLVKVEQQCGTNSHWSACAVGQDCFFLLDYLGELGAAARLKSAILINPWLKEDVSLSTQTLTASSNIECRSVAQSQGII